MSFTQKNIEVRITLDANSFGGKGTEKLISGLPVSVRVTKITGAQASNAQISVSGMAYEDMAQLTTLAFRPLENRNNKIAIYAGDDVEGLSLIFAGEIYTAYADFNSSPVPKFEIEALCGMYGNLKAVGPQTVATNVPVSKLIEQQAKEIGYAFRNEGVTTQITNAIFNGSPVQKMKAMAKHVGADIIIEDNSVLLLPKNVSRKGSPIFISAQSGMIGYPSFSGFGLEVKTIFNPAYLVKSDIEVQSVVPKASGRWRIEKTEHILSANFPKGGPWESALTCTFVSNKTSGAQQ